MSYMRPILLTHFYLTYTHNILSFADTITQTVKLILVNINPKLIGINGNHDACSLECNIIYS